MCRTRWPVSVETAHLTAMRYVTTGTTPPVTVAPLIAAVWRLTGSVRHLEWRVNVWRVGQVPIARRSAQEERRHLAATTEPATKAPAAMEVVQFVRMVGLEPIVQQSAQEERRHLVVTTEPAARVLRAVDCARVATRVGPIRLAAPRAQEVLIHRAAVMERAVKVRRAMEHA